MPVYDMPSALNFLEQARNGEYTMNLEKLSKTRDKGTGSRSCR